MDTTEAFDPKKWDDRINPFAKGVSKNSEDITKALAGIVGEPSDQALLVLSNPEASPDSDIWKALEGLNIPTGIFKLHLAKLRGPAIVVENGAGLSGTTTGSILPTIPDDPSFIDQLKIGGTAKVNTTDVISAVKASIAAKLGLFDIPDTLKQRMELFAEQQDEPVGEEYFKLQKLVTKRSYAEVLNALGIEGTWMSEAKKNKLLQKLDEHLWAALQNFHTQLLQWQDAWLKGAANPMALVGLLAMGQANKGGVMMPPGMMNPPDTAGLRDEAEGVINSINKVFAGTGIPVARALAYDAIRIKEVLENPALPAAIGAANRDQMLKTLGIGVGADFVRLERNLSQFTLAIMEFHKIPASDQEYAYLAAMIQLGANITWDKIGEGKAGIGGARRKERAL